MLLKKNINHMMLMQRLTKKALNKEKELFSYLNEDNATQSEVDGKSKDLSKAYKEMNNKFNAYSKAIEKVKREKQDVDQLK
ncbi:YkyA family protein [Staphylococcus epidermidis]